MRILRFKIYSTSFILFLNIFYLYLLNIDSLKIKPNSFWMKSLHFKEVALYKELVFIPLKNNLCPDLNYQNQIKHSMIEITLPGGSCCNLIKVNTLCMCISVTIPPFIYGVISNCCLNLCRGPGKLAIKGKENFSASYERAEKKLNMFSNKYKIDFPDKLDENDKRC